MVVAALLVSPAERPRGGRNDSRSTPQSSSRSPQPRHTLPPPRRRPCKSTSRKSQVWGILPSHVSPPHPVHLPRLRHELLLTKRLRSSAGLAPARRVCLLNEPPIKIGCLVHLLVRARGSIALHPARVAGRRIVLRRNYRLPIVQTILPDYLVYVHMSTGAHLASSSRPVT